MAKISPSTWEEGVLAKGVPKGECLSRSGYTVQSQPPPPRFGDPVSPNQLKTLARISGFLIVVVKKTIC